MFEREDWALFRTLDSLGQKAGVHREQLPQLVAKELVDNALDAGAGCRFGDLDDGGFFVEDDGSGIAGADEEVADLFSINRPLRSSKLLRLPTRGALGNGLRVVAGAVLASDGALTVKTRGRSLRLVPQDDGTTLVEAATPWEGAGTRIEVVFGPALVTTHDQFVWARQAHSLAGRGESYRGRSSPWWFDADSFWQLLQAAGSRSARDVVAAFEGCSRTAAEIAAAFHGRTASSLDRPEAAALLSAARKHAKPVQPTRLGFVGRLDDYPGYARATGEYVVKAARFGLNAEVPFTLEVWAKPQEEPGLTVCVNRTPVVAELQLQRLVKPRTHYAVFGCGLGHRFRVGKGHEFGFLVNVQTPYMPITNDGKEPNLRPILDELLKALSKAARGARRLCQVKGVKARSQKQVILEALPAAIAKASGDGRYRFSLRQLFYAVRPAFLEAFGQEPSYDTFCDVIRDYEANQGRDIPGMYRDTRGTLYHPHTGEEIPLGTLTVEKYRRPAWTFNKLLYSEKEGLFPILREARWPERHDCALVTSKGFASRAVRDVLDLLGDTGEPLDFYCIHDGDGPGTLIYQALQEGTKARRARTVRIVNLGLEPEEALALGLGVEPVRRKDGRAVAVAAYVPAEWKAWLQENRVELNAMSTPQFLEWLNRKFAAESGKVIPPQAVLAEHLEKEVEASLRERITAEILREGRLDERVAVALDGVRRAVKAAAAKLPAVVAVALANEPAAPWSSPVSQQATALAGRHCRGRQRKSTLRGKR
jgi:hypothetical protein